MVSYNQYSISGIFDLKTAQITSTIEVYPNKTTFEVTAVKILFFLKSLQYCQPRERYYSNQITFT